MGIVDYLQGSLDTFALSFKEGALEQAYDYSVNLTSIQKVTAPYGSDTYNDSVGAVVLELFFGVTNFIFNNFGVEGAESKTMEEESQDALVENASKLEALVNLFNTVFAYFFIAAGCFLIILAVMYWFSKTKKTGGEWASIVVRVVAGMGLLPALSVAFSSSNSSGNFMTSPWPIPVVMLGYLVGK